MDQTKIILLVFRHLFAKLIRIRFGDRALRMYNKNQILEQGFHSQSKVSRAALKKQKN